MHTPCNFTRFKDKKPDTGQWVIIKWPFMPVSKPIRLFHVQIERFTKITPRNEWRYATSNEISEQLKQIR